MKLKALFLPVSLLLIVTLFLWKALFHDVQAVPSRLIGKQIPDLSAPGLYTDKTIDLEQYRGKAFILNVFASWCGYCEAEHAFWLKLKKQSKIALVGLSYRDAEHDAKAWLQRLKNPYEVILVDRFGFLGFSLGVYGTPETFLIDPKGIVRQRWVGPIDEAVWKKEFLPIINTF